MELTPLPAAWTTLRLEDVSAFITKGATPTTYGFKWEESGIPFLRSECVAEGGLDMSEAMSISPKAHAMLRRSEVCDGDILMTITGYVGRVAVLQGVGEANINQHVARVRISSSEVNSRYVFHALSRPEYRRHFNSITTGQAYPQISLRQVRETEIPIPPLHEQSAIATVLSDADALLSALDALIAKQRAIKQGAMQELLTGKRRLPGFGGEWETKLLGDVANIKTGSRNNEDKMEGGEYPFFVRSEFVERINSYSHDCEAILVPGEGRIGEIFHYINGRFDVHQRVYAITQFAPEVSGHFIHLCMKAHFGPWAMQNTVKATVDSLRLPTFQNFQIRLPPTKEEQAAIAETLGDMDAEIAALEAKREKTALLKQGMMQELLTGRIRLVQPASVSVTTPAAGKIGGRRANVHFMRSVLAAELIDQLHNEPTFGHVKFEKLIFLAEHLCNVDTGSNYHRDAAGPYDNRALRSIDSQLKTQKWFEAKKVNGGRYQYLPLEKRGGHKDYFDRYYASIRSKLDKIIATFRTARTEQCEIVATLYGAWDDLLRQGKPANDDAIVDEVLNHWHEDKKRITAERWRKALSWMREKGLAPEGAPKA